MVLTISTTKKLKIKIYLNPCKLFTFQALLYSSDQNIQLAKTPEKPHLENDRIETNPPPISDEMFKCSPKMGSFKVGDSTFYNLVANHAIIGDFRAIEMVFDRMKREKRVFLEKVFILVFKAYGKSHLPEKAVELFDRMVGDYQCRPTVRSFNSVLNVIIQEGLFYRSLEFYSYVIGSKSMNIVPNVLSFNLVIKAMCKVGLVDRAIEAFREMPVRKCVPDVFTYCTLMDGLCKENRLDEAVSLLDEMQIEGCFPNSATFNVLINGLCKKGDLSRAAKLVENMFLKGCIPNEVTYNTLLHGLCLAGKLDKAISLLNRMVSNKCVPNDITFGTIINGLVKQRRAIDGANLLVSMEERGHRANQFVYSSLISGLFKEGKSEEALRMWKEMTEKGCKPNTVLYSTLVDGLCRDGKVDEAKEILSEMVEWESSQEQAKQKVEDEMEQERLQMAMIDWHDFSGVVDIDFADDEDDKLPPPMTLQEVIRRSKMSTLKEEIIEPGKEVQTEMDKEEVQLVEEGMRISSLTENGDDKPSEPKATPMEVDPPMRIVKDYRRPEERIHAERDPTKYVVSPITGELILKIEMAEHIRISLIDPKYKEQKERMFAKIRDSTLAQDDEIFKNIMGLARTRPDIFGTTEEEVSSAMKAEIERKNDVKQKQDMSQNSNGEDINYVRTLMQMNYAQQPLMANPPPPVRQSNSVNPPGILVPPQPGSQFMSLRAPQPYVPHLMPQQGMHMVPPPPMSQAIFAPPPPEEEDLPPLPKEPEPKRQRLDDSFLIPEEQFLAQHQGPAHINVSVPNVDGANLRGQVLEITVQSLSEAISTLKERIAGEIQLPSNKQKLSGKTGFLKDNLSLAYYNVAGGGTLSLSLRERGGRKR